MAKTTNVPLTSEQKKIILTALDEFKAGNHGPSPEDLMHASDGDKIRILNHFHWLHRTINDTRLTINRAFRSERRKSVKR